MAQKLELYMVSTEAYNFPECDQYHPVIIEWFIVDRNGDALAEVEEWIKAEHVNFDNWEALDEFFTHQEAQMLKYYLDKTNGFSNIVTALSLPQYARVVLSSPMDSDSSNESPGVFDLSQLSDYDLPFKVVGYYDATPAVVRGSSIEGRVS